MGLQVAQIDEVEVGGGDLPGRVAEVAGDGERLQKHLRANDARAKVHVDAAFQFGNGIAELVEVDAAALADGGEIHRGMLVDDVRAQGLYPVQIRHQGPEAALRRMVPQVHGIYRLVSELSLPFSRHASLPAFPYFRRIYILYQNRV